MKILGYMMLHYGAEYLEYSLYPLTKVCEKVVILYSLNPSHNPRNGPVNDESRMQLKEIAEKYHGVQWVDVRAKTEAEHRGAIWDYTDGYDVLINADYDEVWSIDDLRKAVSEVYRSPFRAHGIDGFIHFWRSFNYVVAGCETPDGYYDVPDFFRPVRLWHLREKNTSREPSIKARIYHFGYAIKRRKMIYKMSIHGHRAELRPEWADMWHNWTPEHRGGHFHPTSLQIWREIRPFNRMDLPKNLHKHPYFNRQII